MCSHVPATGWRGQHFLLLTTGVTSVPSHMISLAAAWTNHRTAISNCTYHASRSWVQVHFYYRFVQKIYCGTSVLLCGVSFISLVEMQFLVYV